MHQLQLNVAWKWGLATNLKTNWMIILAEIYSFKWACTELRSHKLNTYRPQSSCQTNNDSLWTRKKHLELPQARVHIARDTRSVFYLITALGISDWRLSWQLSYFERWQSKETWIARLCVYTNANCKNWFKATARFRRNYGKRPCCGKRTTSTNAE